VLEVLVFPFEDELEEAGAEELPETSSFVLLLLGDEVEAAVDLKCFEFQFDGESISPQLS
jgi:hypothetical protein